MYYRLRLPKEIFTLNNTSKIDFQIIYNNYKALLLEINLDLVEEFNKNLEIFNFKMHKNTIHLVILRCNSYSNHDKFELHQVLTHGKKFFIKNKLYTCYPVYPRELIIYKEDSNLLDNEGQQSYLLNSLIYKDSIYSNNTRSIEIVCGLSDDKVLRYLSLHNFIKFKINFNKMYLQDQNVKIPLQGKFNKKNLYLKDLINNEYLYNSLIKNNKIFNLNHKNTYELDYNLEFLNYLDKITDNIIHTLPFELMITNKSHLISDDFIIN